MLNRQTAPPGADYGNYLTQVNILNGNDLRGWGLRHQPVFFFLLDGFTKIFDVFMALKVAAALVFSVIVFPFFFLAKNLSGDDIAAAVATGLFAFFIAYTEMIAWGGNPNFLGFSFMLLTLYFLIDVMNKPSKANIILTGLCLSLVIGSHILVAIYTFGALFLFGALYLVFVGNRKKRIIGNIKNFIYLGLTAVVFTLPWVPYYLAFMKNSSSQSVGFQLVSFQFGVVSVGGMWSLITTFFVIGAVGGMSLFALSKTFSEQKKNALLLASMFLTAIVFFMITAQPERWIYFLPIPFLLCFSIFLKKLFVDVKHVKKTTIAIFTVLYIVTIAVNSNGLAFFHFTDIAQPFYQFITNEEIQALNWVKNNTLSDAVFATSGHVNDVGGGGNSYAWWVEGYANRICMFTGDLQYFSYQFERENVNITNRIFAGTYGIEYGNLRVTEASPAGKSTPTSKTTTNNSSP
jgi:hypothetical protein